VKASLLATYCTALIRTIGGATAAAWVHKSESMHDAGCEQNSGNVADAVAVAAAVAPDACCCSVMVAAVVVTTSTQATTVPADTVVVVVLAAATALTCGGE
jgi:hypothetical protein